MGQDAAQIDALFKAQYGPKRGNIARIQVANAMAGSKNPLAQAQAEELRHPYYSILTTKQISDSLANTIKIDPSIRDIHADFTSGLPDGILDNLKGYAWFLASQEKTGTDKGKDADEKRRTSALKHLKRLVDESMSKNHVTTDSGLFGSGWLASTNSDGESGKTYPYVNLGLPGSQGNIREFSTWVSSGAKGFDEITQLLHQDQRDLDVDRTEVVRYKNGNNGLIAVDEEGKRQTLLDIDGNRIEISDVDINTNGANALQKKYERVSIVPIDRVQEKDMNTESGRTVFNRLHEGDMNPAMNSVSTNIAKLTGMTASTGKVVAVGQAVLESSLNPNAINSRTGATGTFQMLLSTVRMSAKELNVEGLTDAELSKKIRTEPKFAAKAKNVYDRETMKRIDIVFNSLTPLERAKVKKIDILQMKWLGYVAGWNSGYISKETLIKLSQGKVALDMKLTRKVKGKDGKITEVKKSPQEAIEQFRYIILGTAVTMGRISVEDSSSIQLMLSKIADEFGDNVRQALLGDIKKMSILGRDINTMSGTDFAKNNMDLLGAYRGK